MNDNDAPEPENSDLEDRSGTLLSGRYQLDEQIGSGGMGEVWRATDTLLSRQVAVKVLHPSQMNDSTSRARFRTEARITAALSHPGIAQVYDYGEQDDIAFLVMELVPGEPLSSILKRRNGLEPGVTLDIVAQAAQALGAAHARGVVHRDIKPGNLLVTEDGTVKLTDFGIARGDESIGLTQTGMVMGTAQYISPEQASGNPATHASDIYSLGVVAYECLAGEPPFTSDTPLALALAHVREPPPPLPGDIPGAVRALVEQMLAKSAEGRPASSLEVAQRAKRLRATVSSDAGGTTTMDLPDVERTAVAGFGAVATGETAVTAPGGTSAIGRARDADPTFPPGYPHSAKLAGESAPKRGIRQRAVLIAVAAVAILVLGTALVSQLLSGGGGAEPTSDNQLTRTPTPTMVEESPTEEVGTEEPVDPGGAPPQEESPEYEPQPQATPTEDTEESPPPTTETTEEPSEEETEPAPGEEGDDEDDTTPDDTGNTDSGE